MVKISIIAFLAAILLSGAVYFYNSTQAKIQELVKEKEQAIVSAQTNEAALESLKSNVYSLSTKITQINEQLRKIQEENFRLREKFEGSDLSFLAEQKPELVQRIITDASNDAMRCFEILSGSPLTENEKNETSSNSFNSECPELHSVQ